MRIEDINFSTKREKPNCVRHSSVSIVKCSDDAFTMLVPVKDWEDVFCEAEAFSYGYVVVAGRERLYLKPCSAAEGYRLCKVNRTNSALVTRLPKRILPKNWDKTGRYWYFMDCECGLAYVDLSKEAMS